MKKSLSALGALLMLTVGLTALLPLASRAQGNSQNAPPTKDVNVVNNPGVIVANLATDPALVGYAGTHLGRDATEHVTLYRLGGGTLQRVSADGVPDGVQFVVPAGKVLVVTDMSWVVGGVAGIDNDKVSVFRLMNNGEIVHLSMATLGTNPMGGSSDSMPSGIVYAPGTSVTFVTTTASALDESVHGYLSPSS